MKNHTLVLSISLSLVGTLVSPGIAGADDARQPYRQLLYLHYENSDGERGITTFDYSERGCPEVCVWERLDGNRSSLNRLSYDDNGNLVRKYREFSDGMTSEELYEYDAEGRLVKESFSRSDGVTGTAVHEYDANGELKRTLCDKYKGWFDGELIYTMTDGKRTEAGIFRDGKRAGEIIYDYDAGGRLVKEQWQLGEAWSQTLTYEYQKPAPSGQGNYTSANVFITPREGFAVARENYDYSGKSGGPSYYGYEPGGKLVAKRFVRSDGLTTNTAFLYGADRRLVRSYRVYADGRHGVFSYRFNDAGKLVERDLKISDGGIGSEVYQYDSKMRLVEARYKNFDSWLSGTISFEYENSHISKGVFKGENDFDAEITFGYDEFNQVVSIHWELSYGGTQTYTFEYAPYDKLGPLAEPATPKAELAEAVELPATPAGKRLGEIIELMNEGAEPDMVSYMEKAMTSAFLQTYSAQQQAGFWLGARKTYPDLRPVHVKKSEADKILVTTQSESKLGYLDIAVIIEPDEPNLIVEMGVAPAGPPPGMQTINDPELLEKIETLANLPEGEPTPVVFVCAVSAAEQLDRAFGLAESIRAFAGEYSDAPIWVFGPEELTTKNPPAQERFASIGVALKSVEIPDEAGWYFLSNMVFTAAEAERQAAGKAAILVFMGSDTIVLQKPGEFILPEGVSLGYCTVMHKNISPLYSEPLNTYWSRAYEIMNLDEAKVFPMVTPADNDTIRPYFNAGCMAVRPERGLLQTWSETFLALCADTLIRKEAEQDQLKRVFTFQVALTGTFLNNLKRDEMKELSRRYNYPIFFKEMFGGKNDFHDITDAVTIRYENFFNQPVPDWDQQLKGPADRIAWIKAHYTAE